MNGTQFSRVAVWVACLSVFALCLMYTGPAIFESKNQSPAPRRGDLRGAAVQVARVGISSALDALRSQSQRPVLDFGAGGKAQGLKRRFQIADNVWGRFDVPLDQVRDVSLQRGCPAPGSMWRVVAEAVVYAVAAPTQAEPTQAEPTQAEPTQAEPTQAEPTQAGPTQAGPIQAEPTQVGRIQAETVLERETLVAEFARLSLRLPGQAALCIRDSRKLGVRAFGVVLGGADAAGVCYGAGLGHEGSFVRPDAGGIVEGSPSECKIDTYDDGYRRIFGVDRNTFEMMADDVVSEARAFPMLVPDGAVLSVNTGMSFSKQRPLKGEGVICIHGDVTFQESSASEFRGLLYVDGNLTIGGDTRIRGAVIVTGAVRMSGTGQVCEIRYDDRILQRLRRQLGEYRRSSPIRRMPSPGEPEHQAIAAK